MTTPNEPKVNVILMSGSSGGSIIEGGSSKIILPKNGPGPTPPPIEDEEVKDVAYVSSSHDISESTSVPEFDTLLVNALGGTFDVDGLDGSYPYCWTAAEDGWYKVQIYQRFQIYGFDDSGLNTLQLVHTWDGSYSNTTGGFSNEYTTYQVPAGFPQEYYDYRTVTKYFACATGEKIQLKVNASYVQSPDTGALAQEFQPQTTFEVTKIADYTPA